METFILNAQTLINNGKVAFAIRPDFLHVALEVCGLPHTRKLLKELLEQLESLGPNGALYIDGKLFEMAQGSLT
jgi:hypothetical protein